MNNLLLSLAMAALGQFGGLGGGIGPGGGIVIGPGGLGPGGFAPGAGITIRGGMAPGYPGGGFPAGPRYPGGLQGVYPGGMVRPFPGRVPGGSFPGGMPGGISGLPGGPWQRLPDAGNGITQAPTPAVPSSEAEAFGLAPYR